MTDAHLMSVGHRAPRTTDNFMQPLDFVYVLCNMLWLFEISRLDSAWQTTTVPWKVLWRLLFLSNRTSFNQFHIKWTHFWCTDSITYFFFITSEQKSSFKKRFKKNWKEQYTSIIKNNDKKQNKKKIEMNLRSCETQKITCKPPHYIRDGTQSSPSVAMH